jgi:hypothetical protein
MTRLVWDKVDDRLYKTGIDRGVLYVPNAQSEYDNGFAWNGLTAVEEDFGQDTTEPYYFDGVKYLDSYNTGDFAAKLSAFTYPDEFLEFEGMKALGNGLYVDDQAGKVFGLSYRTLIGSYTKGLEQGYRIHLLYNLTANPGDLGFQNGSNLPEVLNFEWDLQSVPEKAFPYRPTAHIILDSQFLFGDILDALEEILYGTEDIQPRLPSLAELIDFVSGWNPRLIIPAPTTGLAQLVNGAGDLTQAKILGFYSVLPTTRLVATKPDGFYLLEEGL